MTTAFDAHRVAQRKQEVSTRQTSIAGRPGEHDSFGTGITLHCTVPYGGVGAEDIIHRFDNGTLVTEARDFLNAERTFYHYVGGQGSQDLLANAGVIGTHPIATPAFDPDYMQMTNDISIAVRFRTLQPSNPNVTQFAVLNMTPTSVTHPPFATLITHTDPTVGFFDQIVALNATTLLLVQNRFIFGSQVRTCVVTRNGASLSAGPIETHTSGFVFLSSGDYKVTRINDSTAFLVAPDSGQDVVGPPFNQRMVKGFTLTVSGSSTTIGPTIEMHGGFGFAPQISPTPAGYVVIGIDTNHSLPGAFVAYSVWAVNPLTGDVGPQVFLDYEFTGTTGWMQPTGRRQAAAIYHGIDPAAQVFEIPGTEEFIYGLVVDVAADLTVTPTVNLVSAEGESDADFLNAGRGTDVGMIRMWHDRTRGRGHLYGDAQSWISNQGGISHYTVGGGPRDATKGSMPKHRVGSKERV